MTDSPDDQFSTIEEVMAALRSPARADELQDEEEVVAAMAAVTLTDGPKEFAPMTTTRSRSIKVAVIAGAAVLSLAGVAAATGALHEPAALWTPNEPERAPVRPEPRPEYLQEPPASRALHEPAAPWLPNEPKPARERQEAAGTVLASTDRVTAVTERTRRAQ